MFFKRKPYINKAELVQKESLTTVIFTYLDVYSCQSQPGSENIGILQERDCTFQKHCRIQVYLKKSKE